MDLGIEVILELFSQAGLQALFDYAGPAAPDWSANARRIAALRAHYVATIADTLAFLQGKQPTLGRLICTGNYLPQAARFSQIDELDWAFGGMGVQDKAKHLATLYLEDLSDFIIETVDENFGFSRYAERLGRSANSFDEIYAHLQGKPTYFDRITWSILAKRMKSVQPKLVCLSVPFPGNLYSAFRCGQFIRQNFPETKIGMGGGFPNTELRSVSDPRVFEFLDFISLDDGELPIQLLAEATLNPCTEKPKFKRTFLLENGQICYNNSASQADYKQSAVGTPDYSDLPLDQYISAIEVANPMHSLWTDGRWNKLSMAHGCYWKKCTFCDISLDYIRLYEPVTAKLLVDRMEEMMAQTGEKGFHFVDEAAPPALMKALALEIIRRELTVTWWTNIRFEKSFTHDLCQLLKAAGCIAVSGGLEVASDRLLKLIQKGVTVAQVAQVTTSFSEAGLMVHAYLMYGFPSQTIQETVDSLEMVRQMFALGILKSGFWHQFALTAHSPVGLNPADYGILPETKAISFANNDVQFQDSTQIDHGQFSFGLKKSLLNFMHDIGFDLPLQNWFEFEIPPTAIEPYFIENALNSETAATPRTSAKVIWLGTTPFITKVEVPHGGQLLTMKQFHFHSKAAEETVLLSEDAADWLLEILPKLSIKCKKQITFSQFKNAFEAEFDDFESFWHSEAVDQLRDLGLLVV